MMRTIKRLFKNKKGIDTILAALLMVVIVVVASVMVYAWSTGLLGSLLVTPNVGKEALNQENYAFNTNGTSATLYIRNTGSASVSFASYYVKDSAGNQYSRTTWTSAPPAASPNSLATAYINIGASCGSCTNQGSPYTYTAGNSYTVTIITTRNNQFVFTIIR
ncbi:MAG: hypothetical protein AUJ07_10890 [Crenarchaeota archaeon 13_1_40CM_3_53_5]|nr:MAG: hypothetical protein AUJ07_10890 [Crenarchaeota archaeon 13_1_40CM_3_53_5]